MTMSLQQHAAELLIAFDRDNKSRHELLLFMGAACRGAEAMERCPQNEAAPLAFVRAFLMAMVDPLHPELDWLREDPTSGEKVRAARKGGAA